MGTGQTFALSGMRGFVGWKVCPYCFGLRAPAALPTTAPRRGETRQPGASAGPATTPPGFTDRPWRPGRRAAPGTKQLTPWSAYGASPDRAQPPAVAQGLRSLEARRLADVRHPVGIPFLPASQPGIHPHRANPTAMLPALPHSLHSMAVPPRYTALLLPQNAF
jgi:hypothetical protein